MKSSNYWIKRLGLTKHPEGGYYRETYRAGEEIERRALPNRYSSDRCFATAIYYLLEQKDFSRFHRLQSDETWHFYQGKALELFVIDLEGKLNRYLLGADFDAGEKLQITINRNQWFAARIYEGSGYTLVGCTMAPGFYFDDFEMADRSMLSSQYPDYKNLIGQLTAE